MWLWSWCGWAIAAEPAEPVQTLTLPDAVERFREASPALESVAARVAEARATARTATAPLLPVVAARGGYTRNNEEVVISLARVLETLSASLPLPVELDPSALPDDLIIQPLDQWSGALDVTVPLVVPSAWADHAAARAAVDAADASGRAATREAEAGLVKAAWWAAAAERVVDATAWGAEAARTHRDSAQRRLDAGVGTELDVLRADTELARREGDHLQAVADLDGARRALGALLDVRGPVRVTVDALPEVPRGPSWEGHPELVAAEARATAARKAEASAWLRHAPTLAASGTVMGSDVPFPTGLRTGWRVGVQATWVLFDGGARYGLLDTARARERQAEAEARRLTLDLDRRVADAEQAVDIATERLALAERGVVTATAAEQTAERLYRAGVGDALQTLDAQQRRIDAEVALAGATARLAAARADLSLVAGS